MLACCTCGCAPTVSRAKGLVAFLPVRRPPAGSGYAGSCGFSFPIWFPTFAMGSPLQGQGCFVLDQNKGLVCFLFLFGLFLRVVTALRDITIWVEYVGRFSLLRDHRLSWVLRPFSFWLGFEPLSGASLRAQSLLADFLVVLAGAASLREFLGLSLVIPWPKVRFPDHLHCS